MKPLICAHRGASGYAPENTRAALNLAAEQGADMAEVDAQLTADGEVVLIHDAILFRTTGTRGPVADHTLAQIQELDAGGWFGREWAGERIPTLVEALTSLADRIRFNIELKGEAGPELEEKVVDLVQAGGWSERCLLTSFNRERLDRLTAAETGLELGHIVGRDGQWQDLLPGPVPVLSVHADLVDRELVTAAHAAGKQVHVWTVNTAAEFRMMNDYGVDAMITNFPDRLAYFLDSR